MIERNVHHNLDANPAHEPGENEPQWLGAERRQQEWLHAERDEQEWLRTQQQMFARKP